MLLLVIGDEDEMFKIFFLFFSSDVSSSSISCMHQIDECAMASIRKHIFSRVWSEARAMFCFLNLVLMLVSL